MTIIRGNTDGVIRWATFDNDPTSGYPSGWVHPEVSNLPLGIFEALGELTGNDGQECSTPDCGNAVGPEHMLNDAGVPAWSRWHAVTLILRSTNAGHIIDETNPVLLCEECAFPTLFALTGKAP